MGKIWFSLNAILAENERTVQIERTVAGLRAAKERGRVGGRPKGLSPDAESKMKKVKKLYAAKAYSLRNSLHSLRRHYPDQVHGSEQCALARIHIVPSQPD